MKKVLAIYTALLGLCALAQQPAGVVSRGDLLKRRAYETFNALTLYVDTTGNDANACTASGTNACLTIQGALNKVPRHIHHPVTITVGAGTFGCAYISDFSFWEPASASAGAYLLLQGTLANATLATGTATGTSTAATAPSFSPMTFGTITDTTQTWTVNDLRGRFVVVGTNIIPIASNTATTITYVGITSLGTGAGIAYTIQDPSTILSGTACNIPASGVTAQATGASAAMLVLSNAGGNSYQSGTFTIRRMQFTNATGRGIAIIDQGATQIQEVKFATVAGTPIFMDVAGAPGSRLRVVNSSFNIPSGLSGILNTNTSPGSNVLFVTNVAMFGDGFSGLNLFVRYANIAGTSIALSSAGNVPLSMAGLTEGYVLYNKFDCGSNATSVGIRVIENQTSTNGWVPAQVTMSVVDISNCGTGVLDNGAIDFTGLVSGSGNTTALSIVRGGKMEIRSTTTITGTTEISLDGTAYTLADLRALSPKQITDVTTLSTIREP